MTYENGCSPLCERNLAHSLQPGIEGAINGGGGKSLKVNNRGVAISGWRGLEKCPR